MEFIGREWASGTADASAPARQLLLLLFLTTTALQSSTFWRVHCLSYQRLKVVNALATTHRPACSDLHRQNVGLQPLADFFFLIFNSQSKTS